MEDEEFNYGENEYLTENQEIYEEISDSDYDKDSEFTSGDILFIATTVVAGLIIIAIVFRIIRKTFKKIHLKIGNKIELGIETTSHHTVEEKKKLE